MAVDVCGSGGEPAERPVDGRRGEVQLGCDGAHRPIRASVMEDADHHEDVDRLEHAATIVCLMYRYKRQNLERTAAAAVRAAFQQTMTAAIERQLQKTLKG